MSHDQPLGRYGPYPQPSDTFRAAGLAMNAVLGSISKGLNIEAAARILRAEAAAKDQHPKLSQMLQLCAQALAAHPDPAHLCRANFHRLNEDCRRPVPRFAPGMVATQVSAAADAFEHAAACIEGV